MKINKKISSIILVFALIFIVSNVPIISAETITTALSCTLSTSNMSRMYGVHPSSTSAVSASGMAFTVSQTGYLHSLWFGIKREGSIQGVLRAAIANPYPATVAGTNMCPNGIAMLGVSKTEHDPSALPLSATWVEFEFDSSVQLTAGTFYCAYFYIQSINGTWNSSNDVVSMIGTSYSTTPTNKFLWASSGWTAYTNATSYNSLKVDLTDTYGGDPTPTPTPPPVSIPDNYLSATFGISPYPDAGMIDWWTGGTSDELLTTSYTGHNGTYQLMNGTTISARALPDHDYVFDHWEATTGEYVFMPTVNPITFTGTNNFNLTAVCVLASEADTVYIQLPHTVGGRINVIYSTSDGFYQEYTNQNFYAKTGSNLTLQGIYDTGYVYYGMEITPETEGVYVKQVITTTSRDIQALYNCTITGIFALGNTATTVPISDGTDKLTPMFSSISIFLFGDNGVLGAGFGLIVMLVICILLLMVAGKSIEVLMLGVIIATIVNVSVGIWELWTIILIIIAVVAVGLKNSGMLSSSGDN